MKSVILREALFFSGTAIFGPIFFLGGVGYFLDNYFGTSKVFLLSSIGLAFVLTQILMFRKIKEFNKISNTYIKEAEEKRSISSIEE